jgi:hypothetical protein
VKRVGVMISAPAYLTQLPGELFSRPMCVFHLN